MLGDLPAKLTSHLTTTTGVDTREALFEGEFILKENLRGIHPRLYASAADLDEAVRRYQEDPAWCASYLPADNDPGMVPVPLDKGVTAQRSALMIAKLAVAWRITGEEKYHQRLREWLPVLEAYEPPNMKSIGGSVGLTGGHILLGLSIAYDVIQGQGDPELETVLHDVLILQGAQTYKDLSRMPHYAYEQNHLVIPVCGLGVAAMTVVDEHAEATAWGVFSGNFLERTLDAIAYDGWFFEGFSYWNYTLQFPATYAAAQKRTIGGSALEANCFRYAPEYLAHMTLPEPEFAFDFADWGPRVESDGIGFQSGYDWPWHTLTNRVKMIVPSLMLREDGPQDFLRDYLRHVTPSYADMTGIYTIDSVFGMLLQLQFPEKSVPMKASYPGYPPYHYFPDMEVIHWRENWRDSTATAIAFKSGPPAGHHFADLLLRYPEWRPSLGHAHPDAGSFLLFSQGVFLANDTGYTGAKESADHNTILVDGVGQHKGGTAWRTFRAKTYDEYNKIHMEDVWTTPRVVAATAVYEAAYDDTMKLTKMHRRLLLLDGRILVVLDELASETPHEYTWLFHTDRKADHVGEGRYVMTNLPGRLVIQSLTKVAEATVEPTVVETDPKSNRSRPQQRGYHLAMKSPRKNDFEFLTAFYINSSVGDPASFQATKGPGRRVDLKDEQLNYSVWMAGDDALDGSYAYLIHDDQGNVVAVGLCGKSLDSDTLSIELDQPGQVSLAVDSSGQWEVEAHTGDATSVTITDFDQLAITLAL